jgi:hypothetical protein
MRMHNAAFQLILVEAALDLLPPPMRRSLLDDRSFLERWDISTAVTVTLGRGGPSFERRQLYDGIRAAIRDQGTPVPVTASDDSVWDVVARSDAEGLAFAIEAEGKRFSIMDHSALAQEASVRIAWLDRAARKFNLEDSALQAWRTRLSGEPLSDEEFSELATDVELTPVGVYLNLEAALARKSADVATLVPLERRYYERLVGILGSATGAAEYVENAAGAHIERLQQKDPVEGFLSSLLMCSAAAVSDHIRVDNFNPIELTQTYDQLAARGDPISQLAAVEVALPHIDNHPELAPFVVRMAEAFISDDPDNVSGRFALLSAMIVVVASELARRRTLHGAPPFYRKQAAIAQASLIVRAINHSQIDPASVTEWGKTSGLGHIFFLQGLIDLRLEPRWLPDFVSADQLRAEFIGRLGNAAERNREKLASGPLSELLLGQDSKLGRAVRWPFPMLPGPLEGSLRPKRPIPDEVLKAVKSALEAEQLEANSFAGLVNTALVFDMPEGQSRLAAAALRRVRYSVESGDDEGKAFGLIGGLAIVAAVSRGTELADELRILTRVMRRRKRLAADLQDEMRIALIAAASHRELDDWARFAGEWITEIAFGATDRSAAQRFLLGLRRLVALESALARYCARADAALASFSL